MIIKLVEKNIVDLWDSIKFACDKADCLGPNKQAYFNSLLNDLLSNKAQCFVRVNSDKIIETIIISRIMIDKLYEERFLHIHCVYSWTIKSPDKWKEDFDFIKRFAVREKCSYISTTSTKERAQELAEMLGMRDSIRTFILRI